MFRSLEIFQQDLVSPRADKDAVGIMDLLVSTTKLTQNRLQARIITVFTLNLTLCTGNETQINSKIMKEHHTYKKIRSHPEEGH